MDIKRNKSEVTWITIWLSLSLIWISFLVYLSATYGLTWSKDTLAIALLSNIPTAIFLAGLFTMLKSKVYIRTIEFYIHKYDRWNYKDSKYETLYITERVDLYQNFIYYKNTGTSTNKWSPLELEKHCNSLPRDYDDFIGYNTQEEAMKRILETVKNIIKDEKAEVNIKVKNVGTVEIFTIEELKKMIENE
jgi:hypothetical protein